MEVLPMVTMIPLAAALPLRVGICLGVGFFFSIGSCSTGFRMLFIFKVSKQENVHRSCVQPAVFLNMDHENIFKKVLISIGVLVVAVIASSYAYDFHETDGGLLPPHP
jgi:hypothetical protein